MSMQKVNQESFKKIKQKRKKGKKNKVKQRSISGKK